MKLAFKKLTGFQWRTAGVFE